MALLKPGPPSLSPRRSSLLGDGQALASCCPKPRADRLFGGRRIPSTCRASWREVAAFFLNFFPSRLMVSPHRTSFLFDFGFFSFRFVQLIGVLVFSSIPFAAVKAVAGSSLGEALRKRLEETKRAEVEKSSRFKALSEKAREER